MNDDDIVVQDLEQNEEEANQQDEINNINVDNLQYLEEEVSNYLEHSQEDIIKTATEDEHDRPNRISDLPEDYHFVEYEPRTSHDLANQLPIIKDLSEAEQEHEECVGFIQKHNDNLKKALSLKNKEIEKLGEENNSLKICILKLNEQKEKNDNIIKRLNDTISKLKSQNSSLTSENKEYLIQNSELNYKVIELNQKLLSKSSLDAINEKLNSYSFTSRPGSTKYMNDISTSFNGDNNNNVNNEINKLTNKIIELEIENNKLKFENTALKTNIDNINVDNDNEKEIENKLHSNEIESLNKYIKTLNQTVADLYTQQHNYKYNYNNCSISQNKDDNSTTIDDINSQSFSQIFEELKAMSSKIRKLEQEKQQKDIRLADIEMNLKTKENIFKELQITYAELNNYHDQIVREYEDNIAKLKNENEFTLQQLNQKNNEYQTLYKNYQLVLDNLTTISNDNKIANAQFTQITNDYNNKLMKAYAKLKEYKMKIQTLKMKIDELHNEIQDLKYGEQLNQQLNNMHNDFINQQYNNMDLGNNNKNNINISMNNNNRQYEDKITNNINENDDKPKGDLGMTNTNLNMPIITTEEEQLRQLQDFKDILSKIDDNFKKTGNDNENDNNEQAK